MTAKQLEEYFVRLIEAKGRKALYSIQVFLSHDKAIFRARAVRTLGRLPWKDIEEYIEPMQSDPAFMVKKEVVQILAQAPEGKELLQSYYDSCNDSKLQSHILTALKRCESKQSGVLSVYQFIEYANQLFGGEEVQIEGEISAYQVSSFGANQWVFFDLKDEKKQAKIRCFTTIYILRKSRVSPVDGMRVVITGRPRISAKSGIFSINVDHIQVSGEGELLKAYQLLKDKLATEGLFAPDRKRSLPALPRQIGLITSQDAAAYRDFMKVLGERMGGLIIHFAHAQVQGDRAVESITEAIRILNQIPELEVIVLTRGGGSMDDLHAFNDEFLARVIYASKKPIIAAIGHERDETIAEYVADLRASTPSNAAELVTPHKREIEMRVNQLVKDLEYNIQDRLDYHHRIIDQYMKSSLDKIDDTHQHISRMVLQIEYGIERWSILHTQYSQSVRQLVRNIHQSLESRLYQTNRDLKHLERYIASLNPRTLLSRGYSITRFHGKIIKNRSEVQTGDSIETEFAEGVVTSLVIKPTKHENS